MNAQQAAAQQQASAAQQAARQAAQMQHGRQQQLFVRPSPSAGSNNSVAGRWPPGQGVLPRPSVGGLQGRSGASPPGTQPRVSAANANPATGQLHRQQAASALPQVSALDHGSLEQSHIDVDFLDPDQDPNSLRSPVGSVVSSVTTLACALGSPLDDRSSGWPLIGQHSARGQRGVPNGGPNVQESLASMETLAMRVNETMEQIPTLLDEANAEFRADTSSLRAEFRALSEASVSCLVRMEVLERSLKTQTDSLSAELSEKIVDGLAGERENRQELAEEMRTLGRDLRDQFQQEMDRVRDSVMREMRERMDGQKVLREEVQLQQGSLLRMTSRLEESLVELRTELPRLSQEQTGQREEMQRIHEAIGTSGQGGLQSRADKLERLLNEQREQRLAAEADVRQELRELLQNDAARHDQQLVNFRDNLKEQQDKLEQALDRHRAEFQKGLDVQATAAEKQNSDLQQALEEKAKALRSEISDQALSASGELQKSVDSLKQLAENAESKQADVAAGLRTRFETACDEQRRNESDARGALHQKLQSESQELKDQLQQRFNGLEREIVELDDGLRSWSEKRISETEESVQGWVEANVSARIVGMDKSLKKEMGERASTNEHVMDMITHNSERWCQLQAKFDEVLVQMAKGSLTPTVISSIAGSHGASTPVSSNFGGSAMADGSNGGPLGRSLEDS